MQVLIFGPSIRSLDLLQPSVEFRDVEFMLFVSLFLLIGLYLYRPFIGLLGGFRESRKGH